jgi:hypothetical protein
MSDAAEFFANKKKKKKTFKFNANKIDAAAVSSSTHVDAPALSTDHDGSTVSSNVAALTLNETKATEGNVSEQWDDEALAATYVRKGTAATGANTAAALLDIKALDPKRGDQDDIAEKLRVEETKARLAAAREGMEREAQRIKEEREKKEQEKREKEVATASSGKWVPSFRSSAASGGMGRPMLGSSFRKQELDVQDEKLFPDLASADAMLEQQQRQQHHQQQQQAQKIPKKTPVGAGAAWASRRAVKAAAENKEESEAMLDETADTSKAPTLNGETKLDEAVTTEKASPSVNEELEGAGEALKSETATSVSEPVGGTESKEDEESAVKIVRKKKKKKDLSTFEPAS